MRHLILSSIYTLQSIAKWTGWDSSHHQIKIYSSPDTYYFYRPPSKSSRMSSVRWIKTPKPSRGTSSNLRNSSTSCGKLKCSLMRWAFISCETKLFSKLLCKLILLKFTPIYKVAENLLCSVYERSFVWDVDKWCTYTYFWACERKFKSHDSRSISNLSALYFHNRL